ncbi:MAG: hypothetical protein GDA41_11460 [Rhodospirillales bacterium]|nr:hypothetical protein [Rhodospirillales bacterium]
MHHQDRLRAAYPLLCGLLEQLSPLPELVPQPLPVAEAVTKIVVGQMLSRVAADTIYARLADLRDRRQLEGCWKLAEADLVVCGLSRRKVRTVREFAACYERDPASFEAWRDLDYPELSAAVSGHWGMSQWSADMLAIFYFAKPDVFPATDGTLIRVRRILEENYLQGPLQPDLAKPFRTSLARYMWAFLDRGFLDRKRGGSIQTE